MKKFLFSSAILATIALFTACGDDVTEVTEVNEIHQEGIAVLDAGLELSKQKCDSANAGEMLYVTDSAMVFMCDGGTWVSLKGADGENGKNGVDGKPGETGEPGTDGADGDDGESCTAKPVANEAGVEGLEVTCGKTVVGTIWNGTNGEDGDDGESCEISREGNVLTITCGKSIETVDLDELIQTSSSSSSVIASSSSANESSSSVVFPDGVMSAGYYKTNCPAGYTCKNAASTDYLNSGITYGEILDTRDGQVYKVVTIGAQTWMAQNLNYKYNKPTSSLDSSSFCYGGKADSCAKYGRLYIWEEAMKACPAGWHLPSTEEWEALFENVGERNKLKSKNGWNGSGSSEDSYGFAVLPAGYRDGHGGFFSVGNYAYFWSSSVFALDDAYGEYFNHYNSNEYENENYYDKNSAFSVRCLKD